MQRPPLPLQKESSPFFGPNCCAMFWNECKINFPCIFFWVINNDFVHNFKCFQLTKKLIFFGYLSQNMCNVLDQIYVFMRFFFVRFLVFEVWLILYSTVNWGLAKNLEEIFANLIQTLTSEARVLNLKTRGV